MKKKILLLCAAITLMANAWGQTVNTKFAYEGIYYKITSINPATVEVTNSTYYGATYSGAVKIPGIVSNNGVSYTVTAIGERAFCESGMLTSVIIPPTVTSIGFWAFGYTRELSSITISASVNTIVDWAFDGFGGQFNVEAGNSFFSSLDGSLFDKRKTTILKCSSIQAGQYSIPTTVTTIGKGAFQDCRALTSIIIPPSVTAIGDSAFSIYNSAMTSITIPSSVTTIGLGVIGYYYGPITEVICESTNPGIAQGHLMGIDYAKRCTLYVPTGTKAAYSENKNWQGYKEIIEFDITPSLSSEYRNSTLPNVYENITSVTIPNATSYEWSFTNATSKGGFADTTSSATIIPGKIGLQFGETYTVRIRAKVNGTWGQYGQGYTITTPAAPLTRLGARFHNLKMTSLDEIIVAIKVEGATLYLYQFIDEKTNARFRHYNKGNSLRVSDVKGLEMGHSYQVTVLPRFFNSLSQFSVGARIFTPVAK